tara:strand:+ start:440 stop:1114 length:675 start_codon:yes stop_codon:yes gene_type:complete
MKNAIAYYRVSTGSQGKSGLGLEAQQSDVKKYCERHQVILLSEYTEVETGTRKRKRIEIYKALEHCKKTGAILIVSKLDRLSRDVEFTYSLMNSKVPFICLDIPGANQTTIGLMSVLAQGEADRIRERIKGALDAKKARGIKHGDSTRFKGRQMIGVTNSVKVRMELAKIENSNITKDICEKRESNWTYSKIATSLNNLKMKTTRGNDFTPKQVELLYKRYSPQ